MFEKVGYLAKNQDILKNSMKLAKFMDILVYKNIVKQ